MRGLDRVSIEYVPSCNMPYTVIVCLGYISDQYEPIKVLESNYITFCFQVQ